jgi:hypothetical protein
VTGGTFPHSRCVTVSNVSTKTRRVRIIVTPTQPGVVPDSITIERHNAPVGNPLSIL